MLQLKRVCSSGGPSIIFTSKYSNPGAGDISVLLPPDNTRDNQNLFAKVSARW